MFYYFTFFISIYQNVFLDKYSFLEYNFKNIRKYLKIFIFFKDPLFSILLLSLLFFFRSTFLFEIYVFLKYLLLILKVDLGSLTLIKRKEFMLYGNKKQLIDFMLGSAIFNFCFKSNVIFDIIILFLFGKFLVILFALITVLIYLLSLCYYYYVYSQESSINLFLIGLNYFFGIFGIIFFTVIVFNVLNTLIKLFEMKKIDVFFNLSNMFFTNIKEIFTIQILMIILVAIFFILILIMTKLTLYEKKSDLFLKHLGCFKSVETKAMIANFSFTKFKILYVLFLDRSFYVFLTLIFLLHMNNIHLNEMGVFYLFLYVLNLDIASTIQTKFPYIFSFILESRFLSFIPKDMFQNLEGNKWRFFLKTKAISLVCFAGFLVIYYGLSFQLIVFLNFMLFFTFLLYKIYFVNNLILYKHSYREVEDFLLEFENYTLRNFFLINIFEKFLIMIFVFNFIFDFNFTINFVLLSLLILSLIILYLVMDKRIKKNIYMNFSLSRNGGSYDKIFRK